MSIRERSLTLDGKVDREPSRRFRQLSQEELKSLPAKECAGRLIDTRTGEIVKDASTGGVRAYKPGTGEVVVGMKVIKASLRCDFPNSTLTMAVRAQDGHDEAANMVAIARDIKRRLPGVLATITDTAIRGTHRVELMRAGLVPIAPIAALSNGDGKRIEKQKAIAQLKHDHPHGFRCTHNLFYRGGRVVEIRVDSAGAEEVIDFGDPFIRHRANKADHTMYAEYRITCNVGQGPDDPAIDLGVHRINPLDTTVPYNAAENILLDRPDLPGDLRVAAGS